MSCGLEQGFITHKDPRCGGGSVAIAGAVSLALRNETPMHQEAFLSTLGGWVSQLDPSFGDDINSLVPIVSLPIPAALGKIAGAGQKGGRTDGWSGISPFVVPSVLWSLYAFLRHPNDFMAAIRTAISGGGDADTTAAMTGAIIGARLGLYKLPLEWARLLTDQGTWGFSELVTLAGLAYKIKHDRI